MKKTALGILLLLFFISISACSVFEARSTGEDQERTIPEEDIDAYTGEMITGGFEFCPDTYLEISVVQNHEIIQFNFLNQVSAAGELGLEIFGTGQHTGLRAKAILPLEGKGQAGVCQFISSGTMELDIVGRLIPGENNQPNLMFSGQCDTSVQSKPPCGDFGMIPLDKKIHVIIPYRDGGSFEWEWKNLNVGVSGSSKWTLHIPCDN